MEVNIYKQDNYQIGITINRIEINRVILNPQITLMKCKQ